MCDSPDYNIENPSYGEGLADAIKAQVELLTGTGEFAQIAPGGLKGLLPLEEETQLAQQQMGRRLTREQLLGDEQVADDQGRIITGYSLPDQPPGQVGFGAEGLQVVPQGNNLHLIDRTGNSVMSLEQRGDSRTYNIIANGEVQGQQVLNPSDMKANIPFLFGEAQKMNMITAEEAAQAAKAEPIYQEGFQPGEKVRGANTPGLLDLYGPDKVRQIDPETGEVTYGEAGFDQEGEFKGLLATQADAQGFLTSQKRAQDVQDVKDLDLTGQIRQQGDIKDALGKLSTLERTGERSTFDIRNSLLGEARLMLGQGLTDREVSEIQRRSREAGLQSGRIRDIGRITSEATDVVQADRNRQMENLRTAQGLLGGEFGMQQQQFGKALQRLGAEQATAVDPASILGVRSQSPSAQGLLSAGSGLQQQAGAQFLNPAPGLEWGSQQSANSANLAAARIGADAQKSAGLLGAAGQLGSAAIMTCWVAREVYGETNPKWLQFRSWLFNHAPGWMFVTYLVHGPWFAQYISNNPYAKDRVRKWMDKQIGA